TKTLSGGLRRVDVLREGGLGHLHETREGRRLAHRELREHPTVDLDAREAETLDEAVVGDAVRAGRSVDALDPQATELALLRVTVAVGVDERVGDLLLRLAVETRALAAVALGALEHGAALLGGVDRPLDTCHFSKSFCVLRGLLAQEALDDLGVLRSQDDVPAETTRHARRLVLEVVAHTGTLLLDLAAPGDLEA